MSFILHESKKDQQQQDSQQATSSTADAASLSTTSLKADEIDRYFKLKYTGAPRENKVYDFPPVALFWQTNKDRLPTLYQVAARALSTPASSVYSERLFSEYGNIYEKKRSRLLPTRGEKMLFLHHNYPLLEED